MSISDWRYYNHAALPTTAPHEVPDTSVIESGEIWKAFSRAPLLARWTTEFDCGEDTGWYYVIKDAPFDISKIKAKKRYVINKGNECFDVERINPLDYPDELYNTLVAAIKSYPPKEQHIPKREHFLKSLNTWSDKMVFAAFRKEDRKLCAYALVTPHGTYYDFTSMKSIPEFEKSNVNAALVFGILTELSTELAGGKYICDGEKNINHTTRFQDYLESYFGFRKVYAKLNIAYNPKVRWIIKLAYPIRGFIGLFKGIGIVRNLLSVLSMEEIVRAQK